ncbi:MAG: hypothetical protein WKF97_25635 [Chitinophagaceae bacterium]
MYLNKLFYRITHWETWDYRVKYIPLIPVWLWYCLRSGSWWFFTSANPTLTFGGFEGESKKEMYDQLPPSSFPRSIVIPPSLSVSQLEEQVAFHQFSYPFAVKPNVGMMGFMFRKIDNAGEFKHYHEKMSVDYIVQDLIDYPIEVSVFYYRFPDQQKGKISGFVKKEALTVTGDGKSTLWQLMLRHPRARFRLDEMRSKHENRLSDIIPADENFYLSHAANLSRGGKFIHLSHEKDETLLKLFDDLSHYAKHFYYGRYDIKCASIEDLKKGINFSILEFNGSGAEPHHVYGMGNTLLQACRILAQHWNVLYHISRLNHRKGIRYWTFKRGWVFLNQAKKHFKMLKELDAEFIVS